MVFTVCLAGINVAVTSIFDEVYELCRDYLTDAAPDIIVTVTPEDIDYEKNVNVRESQIEGIPVVDYPDSYLETLAVYRKIVESMLGYDTLLMHGAVIAVGNKAWLFTAPSGTGKSTQAELWERYRNAEQINGDRSWPIRYHSGGSPDESP